MNEKFFKNSLNTIMVVLKYAKMACKGIFKTFENETFLEIFYINFEIIVFKNSRF
jgi:hypothetical protein